MAVYYLTMVHFANEQGKIMDLFQSIQHLTHMQILENSHFDK